MTYRLTRRLIALAGVIAAAAVGCQLVPLRPQLPPVPPETELPAPMTADASSQAEALLTYADIARRNPFEPSRQPPRERYMPPGLRAQHAAPPPSAAVAPSLRLLGVAVGPTGSVALIDAERSVPGAEIYRIGDPVAIYRLESILDTVVVLRGAAGVRTLHLESLTRRRP